MQLWLLALYVYSHTLYAQVSPEVAKAKAELDRIQQLVDAGGLPKNRLEQAKEAVEEAEDQAILRRTLFGSLKLEELSEELTGEMSGAASRLLGRQQARIDRQRALIDQGVAPRTSLTPFLEELDARRKMLIDAESRSRLWTQLTEMARAEQARLAELEADQLEALRRAEDDPTYGLITVAKLRRLEQEFERMFARQLPVSARGDTVFHRTLGYNHTGRIDVGINPDTPEGRWLRDWLEASRIPYLAFRGAIRGVSSAPHIHIGPPSTRLRIAD